MKPLNIFWFRRDLRLEDNLGLYMALSEQNKVLPIFIFDKEILSKLDKNDARVHFIHKTLEKMNVFLLEKHGASIQLFFNSPKHVFSKLIEEYNIETVYANHDYEPYAIKRDAEIDDFLTQNNINFKTYKDQVIFEKDDVVKKDGKPYLVYTPYMKQWKVNFKSLDFCFYASESLLNNFTKLKHSKNEISLEHMGFTATKQTILPYKVTPELIENYEDTRNFPALNSTSKLGPHLRFGTVSVREMVSKASKQINEVFLQELIWREFFMQILWHFPHTQNQAFKPKYDRIEWRNNEEEFKLWCKGQTGYPLVDAGMRELNKTGFMHNRVRMLVGSFLCKHLLIDWRWGEAYFAKKLHDYEMSSNVGNWQWVAGTGVDAAPYFRIFNPTTQIQKFDKKLEYIQHWVPDFQELTYPIPIVDHKFARERCLEVYKAALQ